jgi:hypothetical protein
MNPLDEILLAVLAGAETFVDIALFGSKKLGFRGTPAARAGDRAAAARTAGGRGGCGGDAPDGSLDQQRERTASLGDLDGRSACQIWSTEKGSGVPRICNPSAPRSPKCGTSQRS